MGLCEPGYNVCVCVYIYIYIYVSRRISREDSDDPYSDMDDDDDIVKATPSPPE